MTTFKPFGNRILVRRLKPAAETDSGIALPDNAVVQRNEVEIVSAGVSVAHALHKGQRVALCRHAGTEIEVEGEKLLVIDPDDILGVYVEAEEPQPQDA